MPKKGTLVLNDLFAISEAVEKLLDLKPNNVHFDGRKITWHCQYGMLYAFVNSDGNLSYGFEKVLGDEGIYVHGNVGSALLFKRKLRAYLVRVQKINKQVWRACERKLEFAKDDYMNHAYAINRIDDELNKEPK